MVTITAKLAAKPKTLLPLGHRCPYCGGSLIRRAEDGVMSCLSCSRPPRADPAYVQMLVYDLRAARAVNGQFEFMRIDIERMRALQEFGWSYRDIAAVVNVSHEHIRNLLLGRVQYLRGFADLETLVACLASFALLATTAEIGMAVVGLMG